MAPILRLMACGSWMFGRIQRPELIYIVSSAVTSLLLPLFNYVAGTLTGAAAPTNTLDPKSTPCATPTPRVLVVLALDRTVCATLTLVFWELSSLSLIHTSSMATDVAVGAVSAAVMAMIWLACPTLVGVHPTDNLMMRGIEEPAETEDEVVARMTGATRTAFLALKFLKARVPPAVLTLANIGQCQQEQNVVASTGIVGFARRRSTLFRIRSRCAVRGHRSF